MVRPTSDATPELLEAIRQLADDLPSAELLSLAGAMKCMASGTWPAIRATAQSVIAHPHYRAYAGKLIDVWQRDAPDLPPASMAFGLEMAAYCVEKASRAQTVDLVWTGPYGGALRRIDQALLQLIDAAQREILIVTFAAYKIAEIRDALGQATRRGVHLALVIESTLESDGKIAYDGLAAFGTDVAERATIYRWPLEMRAVDGKGRHGSLHAKCAVADGASLLISSANLTTHALTLNMEMGLLISGGALPHLVHQHFAALIQAGVLTSL